MGHQQIRGDFVQAYAQKSRDSWKRGWELIQQRDNEHRTLNKIYGYIDNDGTVPVGPKSHVDLQYKAKYDEITARYKAPYETNFPTLHEWCKREGMSVFECLFIDNIDADALATIAADIVGRPDWEMSYVGRKAGMLVQKLAEAHSIGQTKILINAEIQNHGYAAARCRKMLSIAIWDLGRQQAVAEYRKAWKGSLEAHFSNLLAR